MNWTVFIIGMAALLWPLPLLNALAMDWQDKRAYERRRGHVEELEAVGDIKRMH